MSNHWYDKAVYYQMYPPGIIGAPKENPLSEDTASCRFDELNLWVPHMKKLGCNALYIGPLFESSSHGYDTRDYKLVDRRLGTNADFAHFVQLCHESDIRVVVDPIPAGIRGSALTGRVPWEILLAMKPGRIILSFPA